MSAIALRNVVKKFGQVEVVHDLDLDLDDGEITVLVGPSGCGKTTTLRMIAGLENVSSGRITVGGRDVTNLEPRHRDVSMVFQNYALYPHLSVLENIAFPLMARGAKRAEAHRRAREVAQILEVDALLGRKPSALSGGQQQRVAIGRAIVRSPQVFLFDEPLSNLDAKLRVEMRTEILRLQRQFGTTAVYVTHDQEEAMTLSDTMVVMRDGRIVQQGRPGDLYAQPADTFVAGFVGSPQMNLVEGLVREGVFRSRPGVMVEVANAPDGPATLGVRPEDLLVGRRADGGWQAVVEIVELLGPRAIVSLQLESVRLTAVVEVADLVGVTEGDVTPVSVRDHGIHLYSTETTRLLLTT